MISFFVKKIFKFWDILFLTTVSFLTRFFNLGFPPKVVFDETHFGLYATKYLSHQYYFDIHPPLGKLLLSFFAFLGKIEPNFDFAVNSSYGDLNFLALRFLPAFLGSLFILLLYLFVKEIGFSRRVAFLSSFLILFDNAFLVQSRLILLDIILLFFIFLSLYLFFFLKRFSLFSLKWYLVSFFLALSLGAAISIKLTGFGALGIVLFLSILKENLFSKPKKEILTKIIFFFLIPFLLYFSFFALHFSLLSKTCNYDCGDILESEIDLVSNNTTVSFYELFNISPSGNVFNKFIEDNKKMLILSSGGSHYYQSDWFSWPFMIRPIKYFQEKEAEKTSYIYFLGNPFVWWLGLLGLLGYLYLILRNYFYRFKLKIPKIFYSDGAYFLFLSYLFYFFFFVSIKRFMLMYHYLPALVFSSIIFAFFFEGIMKMKFGSFLANRILFQKKEANIIFLSILALVFLTFLYFLPLSLGIPLTDSAFQSRMWLSTWSF